MRDLSLLLYVNSMNGLSDLFTARKSSLLMPNAGSSLISTFAKTKEKAKKRCFVHQKPDLNNVFHLVKINMIYNIGCELALGVSSCI